MKKMFWINDCWWNSIRKLCIKFFLEIVAFHMSSKNTEKNTRSENTCSRKSTCSKKTPGQKNTQSKKSTREKNPRSKKYPVRKYLFKKKYPVKKYLFKKKYLVKKIPGQKNFRSKKIPGHKTPPKKNSVKTTHKHTEKSCQLSSFSNTILSFTL